MVKTAVLTKKADAVRPYEDGRGFFMDYWLPA